MATDYKLLLSRGKAMLDKERVADARAIFESIIQSIDSMNWFTGLISRFSGNINHYKSQAISGLAECEARTGNFNAAVELIQNVLKRDPEDIKALQFAVKMVIKARNAMSITMSEDNADDAQQQIDSHMLRDRKLLLKAFQRELLDITGVFELSSILERQFNIIQNSDEDEEDSQRKLSEIEKTVLKRAFDEKRLQAGNCLVKYWADIDEIDKDSAIIAEKLVFEGENYPELWLVSARCATENGEIDKAREYYLKAGKKVDPQEYLFFLVRAGFEKEAFKLMGVCPEDKTEAASWHIMQGRFVLGIENPSSLSELDQNLTECIPLPEAIPEKGAVHFRKALELMPYSAESCYWAALSASASGDFAAGLSLMSRAKMTVKARCFLGQINLKAGNIDAALVIFQDLEKSNPVDTCLLMQLGSCYIKKGWFDEAVDALQEASDNGAGPEALYMKAEALKSLGLNQMSYEAMVKALEDKWLNEWAVNAAEQARLIGKPDEAAQLVRKAVSSGAQDPDSALLLALSLKDSGQIKDAVSTLKDTLALFPDNAEIRLMLADITLNCLSDAGACLEVLEGGTFYGNQNARALEVKSLAYFSLNNYREAISSGEEALSSGAKYKGLLVILAESYHKLGDTLKAIGILDSYLQSGVEDGRAYSLLGDFKMELNDRIGAEKAFASAVEMVPEDTESLFKLSKLRFEAGNYEDAELKARAVIKADPNNERGWLMLLDVQIMMHRYLDAISISREAVRYCVNSPQIRKIQLKTLYLAGCWEEITSRELAAVGLKMEAEIISEMAVMPLFNLMLSSEERTMFFRMSGNKVITNCEYPSSQFSPSDFLSSSDIPVIYYNFDNKDLPVIKDVQSSHEIFELEKLIVIARPDLNPDIFINNNGVNVLTDDSCEKLFEIVKISLLRICGYEEEVKKQLLDLKLIPPSLYSLIASSKEIEDAVIHNEYSDLNVSGISWDGNESEKCDDLPGVALELKKDIQDSLARNKRILSVDHIPSWQNVSPLIEEFCLSHPEAPDTRCICIRWAQYHINYRYSEDKAAMLLLYLLGLTGRGAAGFLSDYSRSMAGDIESALERVKAEKHRCDGEKCPFRSICLYKKLPFANPRFDDEKLSENGRKVILFDSVEHYSAWENCRNISISMDRIIIILNNLVVCAERVDKNRASEIRLLKEASNLEKIIPRVFEARNIKTLMSEPDVSLTNIIRDLEKLSEDMSLLDNKAPFAVTDINYIQQKISVLCEEIRLLCSETGYRWFELEKGFSRLLKALPVETPELGPEHSLTVIAGKVSDTSCFLRSLNIKNADYSSTDEDNALKSETDNLELDSDKETAKWFRRNFDPKLIHPRFCKKARLSEPLLWHRVREIDATGNDGYMNYLKPLISAWFANLSLESRDEILSDFSEKLEEQSRTDLFKSSYNHIFENSEVSGLKMISTDNFVEGMDADAIVIDDTIIPDVYALCGGISSIEGPTLLLMPEGNLSDKLYAEIIDSDNSGIADLRNPISYNRLSEGPYWMFVCTFECLADVNLQYALQKSDISSIFVMSAHEMPVESPYYDRMSERALNNLKSLKFSQSLKLILHSPFVPELTASWLSAARAAAVPVLTLRKAFFGNRNFILRELDTNSAVDSDKSSLKSIFSLDRPESLYLSMLHKSLDEAVNEVEYYIKPEYERVADPEDVFNLWNRITTEGGIEIASSELHGKLGRMITALEISDCARESNSESGKQSRILPSSSIKPIRRALPIAWLRHMNYNSYAAASITSEALSSRNPWKILDKKLKSMPSLPSDELKNHSKSLEGLTVFSGPPGSGRSRALRESVLHLLDTWHIPTDWIGIISPEPEQFQELEARGVEVKDPSAVNDILRNKPYIFADAVDQWFNDKWKLNAESIRSILLSGYGNVKLSWDSLDSRVMPFGDAEIIEFDNVYYCRRNIFRFAEVIMDSMSMKPWHCSGRRGGRITVFECADIEEEISVVAGLGGQGEFSYVASSEDMVRVLKDSGAKDVEVLGENVPRWRKTMIISGFNSSFLNGDPGKIYSLKRELVRALVSTESEVIITWSREYADQKECELLSLLPKGSYTVRKGAS